MKSLFVLLCRDDLNGSCGCFTQILVDSLDKNTTEVTFLQKINIQNSTADSRCTETKNFKYILKNSLSAPKYDLASLVLLFLGTFHTFSQINQNKLLLCGGKEPKDE